MNFPDGDFIGRESLPLSIVHWNTPSVYGFFFHSWDSSQRFSQCFIPILLEEGSNHLVLQQNIKGFKSEIFSLWNFPFSFSFPSEDGHLNMTIASCLASRYHWTNVSCFIAPFLWVFIYTHEQIILQPYWFYS